MPTRSSIILLCLLALGSIAPAAQPNVVILFTDDQGTLDANCYGSTDLITPNIDKLAATGVRFTRAYAHTVCCPARAALMTGRHPQRTRAIDTWIGRAMMDPAEVTIAEVMRGAGWSTGIFGKWHLGDCYPMRAGDQGFEESLVLRGGGIGQPADPLGAEGKYTDPTLFHNGTEVQTTGYCTDVYFDAAISWMKSRPSSLSDIRRSAGCFLNASSRFDWSMIRMETFPNKDDS